MSTVKGYLIDKILPKGHVTKQRLRASALKTLRHKRL